MTLNQYLSSPNPAINLCQVIQGPAPRGMHTHFWWDIRNLRRWKDFSLDHILNVAKFPNLLTVPVNAKSFPDPTPDLTRQHMYPETEAVLTDAIRTFYATKVNAALKVCMNANHALAMRRCVDRDGPSFISNYQNDAERMISGNGRGRVVGIVRSYQAWNSTMRSGNGVAKVAYLDTLALLHRHMREHQTRYGFIMTETELVCVRAGTEETPYFGHLELSAPIETRLYGETAGDGLPSPPLSEPAATAGATSAGATSAEEAAAGVPTKLTACLALWYLHMLAKEEALDGQAWWRMNVGPPAALTRQKTMPAKDSWIPLPQKREQRDSKTVRGWVWPSDPYSKKKEGGQGWRGAVKWV